MNCATLTAMGLSEKARWHQDAVRAKRKALAVDGHALGVLKRALRLHRHDLRTMKLIDKLRSKAPLTSCSEIADALNHLGKQNCVGGQWTHQTIRALFARLGKKHASITAQKGHRPIVSTLSISDSSDFQTLLNVPD